MTNRSGGERGNANPKKGKSKCLAPGKLIGHRNSMFHKKSAFVQSSPTTTALTPPTAQNPSMAPTPLSAPNPSSAPTPLLVRAAPVPQTVTIPRAAPVPRTAPISRAAPVPRTAPVSRAAPVPRTAPIPQAAPLAQATSLSAPTHSSSSEVFRFMPTPGLNIQNMDGPSTHASREIPMEENEEEIEEEDEDEDEDEVVMGEENVPPHLITRDDNGKVIIQLRGTGLVPGKEVANAITYAIHKQFYKGFYNWTVVDDDVREKWFALFADKVSWDPRYHMLVKKAFYSKAAVRLSDIMKKLRSKGICPPWIGGDAWNELQTYWKGDVFLKVSSQNKVNRNSARGGAVHTSGRKAHVDVALELTHKLQRDVRPDELFLKTHKRKNGEWVDHRAESTYTTFKEKAGDDVERLDGGTVFKLWTDSAGGRSRGRVYGTGDLAINLKHGSTSFIQQPQNSYGSMFGTSFELERAARIRAEQLAAATTAQLQEATEAIRASNEIARKATEQYQASNEFVKKMESEMNALKAFIMQNLATSNGQSASAVIRPSNPHYDDDLDDQSLSEH